MTGFGNAKRWPYDRDGGAKLTGRFGNIDDDNWAYRYYKLLMTRVRRLRTPAIAGACLIAGVVIGFTIPRTSSVATVSPGDRDNLRQAAPQATVRDVYTPAIRSDNYVRQEQLKIVEMLERQCRSIEQNCQLAEAARRSVERD